MAYNTVTSTNSSSASTRSVVTENVLTVRQEKDFLKNEIFNGNTEIFLKTNTFMNIYDDGDTETSIPLTSVIYTPNRRFFENSRFYKQIPNNNKILHWLKKHNVLVLIYGITSSLDNLMHIPKMPNDSMLLMDNMQNISLPSNYSVTTTTVLGNGPPHNIMYSNGSVNTTTTTGINTGTIGGGAAAITTTTTTNEDIINLMRFENSPFNHRLNMVREHILNNYSCNFSPINYLVFTDLNNETCITKFMHNTINITLTL